MGKINVFFLLRDGFDGFDWDDFFFGFWMFLDVFVLVIFEDFGCFYSGFKRPEVATLEYFFQVLRLEQLGEWTHSNVGQPKKSVTFCNKTVKWFLMVLDSIRSKSAPGLLKLAAGQDTFIQSFSR